MSGPSPDDLRTSDGEVVRRVDLDRAAGAPGNYYLVGGNHPDPKIAGYEGADLARAAIAGDQAATDEFHDLAGLVLHGVTEYSEGDAVRLTVESVGDVFGGASCEVPPHRGEERAVFVARNEFGYSSTRIDAAELVAWILSAEGKAALARRGIHVSSVDTGLTVVDSKDKNAEIARLEAEIDRLVDENAEITRHIHD